MVLTDMIKSKIVEVIHRIETKIQWLSAHKQQRDITM